METKGIGLIGATGSIGRQTLDVIRNHPDRFRLVACAAGRNISLTEKIIREFHPRLVSVQMKEDYEHLKQKYPGIEFSWGEEGLLSVASHPDADVIVNAISGSIGLLPTVTAIRSGKPVALANKETLVAGGHLVMELAQSRGVAVIPVDSEHSAIFQCLNGENRYRIRRILLTASGGSFRDRTRDELKNVTVEEALKHPNWSMGAKVTIDSATMMNKGLEVIEAHWLFSVPYDKINVLIHKESIIHSMVEFIDHSVMAQLGVPDMRIPIQYALTYPDRLPAPVEPLDLAKLGSLHFEEADFNRFPCLKFAYEAGRIGGTMPTVLNAANEMAVEAFLRGEISFLAIEDWVERALSAHDPIPNPDMETILAVDQQTRRLMEDFRSHLPKPI